MTEGVPPPGLPPPDFPPTLANIDFSTTNLRTLPDDLDTKWPSEDQLMFKYSAFTPIPGVVVR
uniref:Uncharacterized protein n=1 Tax=Globisporangium ultimum (strain ATCC 200006 / CBS 805.95 / DAOM BR144) TaxID=431595 RepID=K3WCU6_GLOUD